jgi:hypothetical protein
MMVVSLGLETEVKKQLLLNPRGITKADIIKIIKKQNNCDTCYLNCERYTTFILRKLCQSGYSIERDGKYYPRIRRSQITAPWRRLIVFQTSETE